MTSQVDIETILERLGSEWPSQSSLADEILRRIESQSARRAPRTPQWLLRKSLLATAATLAVVAASWWILRHDNTLYAQAVDAIHRARTFHTTTRVQPDARKPAETVMESWYERGVGFRETVGPEVRLGNQRNFWTYVQGSKSAVRSQSHGIDDIVDRMLDNEELRMLKDEKIERFPAADRLIDGHPCQAYMLPKVERASDPDLKTGKRRLIVLVDDRSRIVRVLQEARSSDRWVAQSTTDWDYDVEIDRALFEPRFADDVRIVDADAVFDDFVDLEKAVYREERAGLWYAIHRVERFDGGGILVVSSVRGTTETLQKYPVTRIRFRPGLFFAHGPAVNYEGSPQGDGYFRIRLAQAGHQGIDLCWWVLVPRGTPPTHFDVAPGKVKIPVGITPHDEFAKAHFADEHGVIHHLTWEIELALPQGESLPTLDAIARRVYADQMALAVVPYRLLDMGTKDHVRQVSEPEKTTAAEFGKAVTADIRSWFESDVEFQLEGQFTPENQKQAATWGAEQAIGLAYEPLVDDATLARIGKRKSLKRLYLTGTKITDAGLRHLGELKELRELNLAKTAISDAGLQNLQGLSSLQTLDVQDTEVTADGVALLKAAIPALTVKQ